jgi:NhaA family Na+:H+ antiporter
MGLMMNLKTADRVLQRVHPISAGLAVPVFAFLTAGVFVGGIDVSSIASSPVVLGVILGLVVGKPIGVVGAAWLVTRFSRAGLSKSLGWWDVGTVGLLAGVGFTVSLLINELAFRGQEEISSVGTLAVLVASTIAAALAIIALQFRKRAYSND